MLKFIALPVGQGDAFVYRTEEITVVVDGGKSKDTLPRLLADLGVTHVDIAICTHNDADHVKGLLGLVRSEIRVCELWLPGSWSDQLRSILSGMLDYGQQVAQDLSAPDLFEAFQLNEGGTLHLGDLGDHLAFGRPDGTAESDTSDASAGADINATIEGCLPDGDEEGFPTPFGHPVLWFPYMPDNALRVFGWCDTARARLFAEALTAGERIRRLVRAAWEHGCHLRWFDYKVAQRQRSALGGVPGKVVPVNAVELGRLKRRPVPKLLDYLALTVSNRESLVFAGWSEKYPRVLFSGDSHFKFSCPVPWTDGMIVTSPHHGAEANANVYKLFHTWYASQSLSLSRVPLVTWVRSDGRFRTRPGNSYLGLPGDRYCTLCRGAVGPAQKIEFCWPDGATTWSPRSSACCCSRT